MEIECMFNIGMILSGRRSCASQDRRGQASDDAGRRRMTRSNGASAANSGGNCHGAEDLGCWALGASARCTQRPSPELRRRTGGGGRRDSRGGRGDRQEPWGRGPHRRRDHERQGRRGGPDHHADRHACRHDRAGGQSRKGDFLREADRPFGGPRPAMPRSRARREGPADDRLQSSLRPEFQGSAGPDRRRRHRRRGNGVDHLSRPRRRRQPPI